MTLHPIEYKEGIIWVDKEVEIKSGDMVIEEGKIYILNNVSFMIGSKIIAQSPNLSLPNIPYVEMKEKEYSLAEAIEFTLYHFRNIEEEQGTIKKSTLINVIDNSVRSGYKFGYKTASAKKFTEEDLRKAFEAGRNSIHFENDGSYWESETAEDTYIQSLQPKIKSIEIEMKPSCDKHFGLPMRCPCILNPCKGEDCEYLRPMTYQKDGKTYLKIK